MKKLKVMTILGTRPEIIRLSIIIKKLDMFFDHILVNTMQNSSNSMNNIFFEKMNIRKPNYFLNVDDVNSGKIIANIISQMYDLILKENPDCVLILGDTNSALSSISAKKLSIPIFHMEAGNRSFDINLPEEVNRKIVDEISDINLVYSERARQNLIDEGKESRWIFKTGSPLYEVFEFYKNQISKSLILKKLNLDKGGFFLLSLHRDENVSSYNKLKKILDIIDSISKFYSKKIIFSLHPKTRRIIEENKIVLSQNIIISEPFDFFDYCCLQKNAYCVISDSGSLAEESYILDFKAISLRNSTERQESLEFNNNFTIANLNEDSILNSINIVTNSLDNSSINNDYIIKNTSDIVVNIINSYTLILKSKYNKYEK